MLIVAAVILVLLAFAFPLVIRSRDLPELESWLETLEAEDRSLEARLRDPIVDLRLNANNTIGCGKMEGRIDSSFIAQFIEGEDPAIAEIIEKKGGNMVGLNGSGQLTMEAQWIENVLMKGVIGSNSIEANARMCMTSAVTGVTGSTHWPSM